MSSDAGEGRAALALLDSLIAVLVDKELIGAAERDACIATTMDRLQGEASGQALEALAALQATFVASET